MNSPNKEIVVPRACVTPVAHTISYRETFHFGNNRLHRSFSFDHIWTPGRGVNGTATTQISVSNFQVPITMSNKRKLTFNKEGKSKRIKQVVSTMDGVPEPTRRRYVFFQIIFWVVTIGLTFVYPISYYGGKGITNLWPLFDLECELTESVIGQSEAIEKVIHSFELILLADTSAVIVFAGPVGVGKSYMTSIIRNRYPWQNAITFVTAQALSTLNLIEISRKSPVHRLVIVEDCNVVNIQFTFGIIESLLNLAKKENGKLIFLVVYTYRSEVELFSLRNKKIMLSNDNYFYIPFLPLNRQAVTQCFNREIKRAGIHVGSSDLETLVDQQMAYVDEIGGSSGCKQIDMKLIQHESQLAGQLYQHGNEF